MSSINKVILIGNLGSDPEIRSMQSGDEVCNLSIATSETWKDKKTGENKKQTEWHRVSIFNQGLVRVCKDYLRKGSKIYIEGQIQTRSWDKDGETRYSTEIVLRGFDSKMLMLDSRSPDGSNHSNGHVYGSNTATNTIDDLDDEIPF